MPKEGSRLSDELTALLFAGMEKTLKKGGWDTAADSFRVDEITAVTLTDPVRKGSKQYQSLEISFVWSGRKPAGSGEGSSLAERTVIEADSTVLGAFETAEEEATVTLSVYDEVLPLLNLSVAGMNNELLTVTEEDDAFLIESRRFGHGVGMSQRGAQQMASAYDMTFTEILAFYYPGMQLMKTGAGALPLTTVEPNLAETPGPSATPTPRPTLMPVSATPGPEERLASVENIAEDSSLNLRDEPSSLGNILMRLYCHQKLLVLNDCDAEGWVHVRTDAAEGYVMEKFLVYDDE